MEVSILCTAYNHEKYIREALEGFVNQKTTFPYEVIINDDASTDHTAEIIREYAEKYAIEEYKPSNRTTVYNLHLPLKEWMIEMKVNTNAGTNQGD